MSESMIRDISLADEGLQRIYWVEKFMPALNTLREEFVKEQIFKGKTIVMSIHLEAKTAYLALTLKAAGANVICTGSNPLSTQDPIAAGLVKSGITVYAWHACTEEEYFMFLNKALDHMPDIIIDDGGDLVHLLHTTRKECQKNLIGGSEETTTGVYRLKILEKENKLEFPMIAVNDSYCKYLFDNRYGTGQSAWDGIIRSTNLTVTGKTAVIAGYGWCGKGVAMRAKGLGAKVIVTEVDPIKAMEAVMDGFKVMSMAQAASEGDIFVTVTGCDDVITKEHFLAMKDGAICCNAGHFDCEVNVAQLKELAVSEKPARQNIQEYDLPDGRKVYIIAEGRLVNLAAGDGHPAEIMDMSFAIQALSAKYLADNRMVLARDLGDMLHCVPESIDREVAFRKLKDWGITIDTLTPAQHKYLYGE